MERDVVAIERKTRISIPGSRDAAMAISRPQPSNPWILGPSDPEVYLFSQPS